MAGGVTVSPDAGSGPAPDPGLAPVEGLPGVGPALRDKLARLGIARLQDLWFHLPRSYEDRTRITPIAELQPGQRVLVEGRIGAVERGFRFRPVLRVVISDDSQASLTLRFFHFRSAQVAQLQQDVVLRCFGEVRPGQHGLEMVHPSYQRLDALPDAAPEDRLSPVYPALDGLGNAHLRKLVRAALARVPRDATLELLPDALRAQLHLPTLAQALALVHAPPPGVDMAALRDGLHPAQQRLVFEELLAHHISLRRQRLQVRAQAAPVLAGDGALRAALLARLPFALTSAQQRVLGEVLSDVQAPVPMLRLVQGDVGSGKTVVAALAALAAVEAGHQVALMAPTELLAEQHLANFRTWLEPLGIEVQWLAGKVKGRERSRVLAAMADGRAQIVVGTHALMQEGVAFAALGLVIVDEQHRFGVHQRLALRDKGREGSRVPHQLVMTATPIPRTLAMTAYADLDVSAIDELPPGRTPVTTVVVSSSRRGEVVERIRAACLDGRQAYWVCTLIEDNDEIEAQAAERVFEELQAALPSLRIGLVHGRQKPAQKTATMRAFKDGALHLLVATTVIEVGVDVPNASLMVIENAERLGLAQLHQLRGRVGRGAAASSCVLLCQGPLSRLARERLQAMRETSDGFVIAERDLALRGPGELLGTRQTGEAGFRIADLARDADLLPQVHAVADALLAQHPALAERLVQRWIGAAERYAGA